MKDIHLWGVKQNNLKNIEIKIPLGTLTVVCGPSGSGKSSLAFETLYAEGQRRYIESMSNYARQFLNKAPKPDIEGIENIPPAISIEQKNSVKSSRSTVGTVTELIDYLRLLYEKLGVPHCPTHQIPTSRQSVSDAVEKVLQEFPQSRGYILCEISATQRIAEGKKLLALLLQEGFLRIMLKPKSPSAVGEIRELNSLDSLKKALPKDSFYLVIDRMSFNPEEKGRIADSIEQAYDASLKFQSGMLSRKAMVMNIDGQVLRLSEENSCPQCDYVTSSISSRLFSFNSPVGACPSCKGFGNILDIDPQKVIPNPELSIKDGALHPFTMPSATRDAKALFNFCKKNKINLDTPWKDLPKEQKNMIWMGTKDFFGVKGLFEYLDQIKYKMHVRVFVARYRSPFICNECYGARLRKEALTVLIENKNINDLCLMPLDNLNAFFKQIQWTPYQIEIANEVIKQIHARLDFLLRVGVHYLTLAREAKTLSGGEFQRIMLANQLGMGLSQALYVLDEPTVGLHPRDNDRLISILKELKDLGNTLVIVEHDHDVICNAQNIIEMGPGSGALGGKIIYSGDYSNFLSFKDSNTNYFLKMNSQIPLRTPRPVDLETYKFKLEVRGATGNNLKNINCILPLHRLVAITGVSGSGKSTLISQTLYPAMARHLGLEFLPVLPFKNIKGVEHVKNVVLIDQSAIGKSARSSPITYMKAFDAIRTLMASTFEAKARGYTAGTFSLNVDGGRCPSCRGTGFEEIDMMFMDNVIIPCDVCDGKKYRPEILEIYYKDKNIADILGLTVSEAMDFFVAYPNIRKPLSLLREVGLGYLQIGQPASTLSGGESQRLKVAKELSLIQQKNTLYILDEPTTGLHFKEVEMLLKVLNKLVDNGASVVVIEHNLDVISAADYIIDLGPEGGVHGGKIVASGSPEEIIAKKSSLTGQYLKKYLTSVQFPKNP